MPFGFSIDANYYDNNEHLKFLETLDFNDDPKNFNKISSLLNDLIDVPRSERLKHPSLTEAKRLSQINVDRIRIKNPSFLNYA